MIMILAVMPMLKGDIPPDSIPRRISSSQRLLREGEWVFSRDSSYKGCSVPSGLCWIQAHIWWLRSHELGKEREYTEKLEVGSMESSDVDAELMCGVLKKDLIPYAIK